MYQMLLDMATKKLIELNQKWIKRPKKNEKLDLDALKGMADKYEIHVCIHMIVLHMQQEQ